MNLLDEYHDFGIFILNKTSEEISGKAKSDLNLIGRFILLPSNNLYCELEKDKAIGLISDRISSEIWQWAKVNGFEFRVGRHMSKHYREFGYYKQHLNFRFIKHNYDESIIKKSDLKFDIPSSVTSDVDIVFSKESHLYDIWNLHIFFEEDISSETNQRLIQYATTWNDFVYPNEEITSKKLDNMTANKNISQWFLKSKAVSGIGMDDLLEMLDDFHNCIAKIKLVSLKIGHK